MKDKLLCILHRSPPHHGAANIGDFIASSTHINEQFNCKFIAIKSSDNIGDIGKVNFKKFYNFLSLYIQVFWNLIFFRPKKIYFTPSIKGVAFYRDFILASLWKAYSIIRPSEIYFHYHTKGVNEFISSSPLNISLKNFFLKNVNIVLLSPTLKKDFDKIGSMKNIYFLPNGVEDCLQKNNFYDFISTRFNSFRKVNVLYLSNMIKSKGYFDVLNLAKASINSNIHFHFAGGWQNDEDKNEFFDYIEEHNLSNFVTYHGFLTGQEKKDLFRISHLFIFPSRYKNEAFPLSILEAFSYGIPVIASDEGAIPSMIDSRSGIIVEDIGNLQNSLIQGVAELVNEETATNCRNHFLSNYSLKIFEEKFTRILSE